MGGPPGSKLANALSLLAIFIALGATAYAAGLGKSSVKSKQIKDGAVQTKDLKDGSVTGDDVADGSLAGADVADDSLTGADIAEGGLQGVTAASAPSVGGLQLKEVRFVAAYGTSANTTLLEFPGNFRIIGSCLAAGDKLDLAAFSLVANARISMVGTRAAGADDADAGNVVEQTSSQDNVFNPGEPFLVDDNLPSISSAHTAVITFSTLEGFSATVRLYLAEVGSGCRVFGTAVGG